MRLRGIVTSWDKDVLPLDQPRGTRRIVSLDGRECDTRRIVSLDGREW